MIVIDRVYLDSIIENSITENKSLEYKEKLPTNSEKDKREFLIDVSSFANTAGGDLIYGIKQNSENGLPESVSGCNIDNIDAEKQRLDNMIRDGIDPALFTYAINEVKISEAKYVIVIRINQSWNKPHRVIYKSWDKFYARNSSGKYPLDVSELRIQFNLSATTRERIKSFREDRIASVLSEQTPIKIDNTAKVMLHLFPISSFSTFQEYNLNVVSQDPNLMPVISGSSGHRRYNFDGFLAYAPYSDSGTFHSYVQLYKNGMIESVDTLLLKPRGDNLFIYRRYEQQIVTSIKKYIEVLQKLSIGMPLFICLSMLNVKNYIFPVDYPLDIEDYHKIDREVLILQEVMMNSYDEAPEIILKTCFDSVRNACGFEESDNYDSDGNWSPR